MYSQSMTDLLNTMVRRSASDLHIVVGSPPSIRINGVLEAMAEEPISAPDAQQLISEVLTREEQSKLLEQREVDFAYSLPGVSRFRVNACFQRDSLSAVLRAIPSEPPELSSLGFPNVVADMTQKPRGIVLVTGPTSSGKTTTLAAMIGHINRTRGVRVVTIEDPIEYLHRNDKALITQREVGRDTLSPNLALRSALRQDPNVILIGEMRDLETIQLALRAAETGHLVLSTLHVTSAPEAVNRIIDVFPPEQQEQVRVMLSGVLEAIFTQTLVPKADSSGRVAAMEILIGTPAVRNLIREGKTAQMLSAMQTGMSAGMQTLEKSLAAFVASGVVTLETALAHTSHPDDLRRLCQEGAPRSKVAAYT